MERSQDPAHVCAHCHWWVIDDGQNELNHVWGECINSVHREGERHHCADGMRCEQFKRQFDQVVTPDGGA